MICPSDILNIKEKLDQNIGQKVMVRRAIGRKRFLEEEAVIENTYKYFFNVKNEEKDTITVYAYAIEKLNTATQKYEYEVYLLYADTQIGKLDKDGNLVAEDGTAIDLSGVKPVAIPTEYTGSQPAQKKLAVYANVYNGKTLKGTWTYRGDYKEVGVDED